MKIKTLLLFSIIVTWIFPIFGEENNDTTKAINKEYVIGAIPDDYQDIYNNFEKIFFKRQKRYKRTPVCFDIQFSKLDTYPIILSNKFDDPTSTLESRYAHYNNNKNNLNLSSEVKQGHIDMFNLKQDEIKNLYSELNTNVSKKEYLILIGVLTIDDGEIESKEKWIIALNPKYSDREWLEWRIHPWLQKQIALTLTSIEGKAMEFFKSTRDFEELSENYSDPLIKFVLEPLYGSEGGTNPFFAQ